jgi:hypothetical protein
MKRLVFIILSVQMGIIALAAGAELLLLLSMDGDLGVTTWLKPLIPFAVAVGLLVVGIMGARQQPADAD